MPVVRARGGLPRFSRLLHGGRSATIVAFGTSLTLAGVYLDRLPSALSAAYPSSPVNLVNRGRNGYMTLAGVFRVAADVLPHRPDLVLIEFSHNDGTDNLVEFIPSALEGMLGQIRSANPACEVAFVYFALPGRAAAGPTPAMVAYESVAAYHGIPSIDMALFSESLVQEQRAVWQGEGLPALTEDGVHHGSAAAGLLGEPFAAAFLGLLGRPAEGQQGRRPLRAGALTTVSRARAADHLLSGVWAVRPPAVPERRGAGIDEEGLAQAEQPGATVRVGFVGTNAFAWMSGNGVIGIRIAETGEQYRVEVNARGKWSFCSLMETHGAAPYTMDIIALNAGLLFGDLNLAGAMT